MNTLFSPFCPFCEAKVLSSTLAQPWRGARYAGTLQQRKPSRMVLSDRVEKGSKAQEARSPRANPRESPWGSMNRTQPPSSSTLQRPSQRWQGRGQRNKPSSSSWSNGNQSPSSRSNGNQSPSSWSHGNQYFKGELKRQEHMRDNEPDPMKQLRMQQTLKEIRWSRRMEIKQALLDRLDFRDMKLVPEVMDAVLDQALGGFRRDVEPTNIQKLAIPAIQPKLDRKERRVKRKAKIIGEYQKAELETFLLAAETGSGKTLAYVTPVFDAIKREERVAKVNRTRDRKMRQMWDGFTAPEGEEFPTKPGASPFTDPAQGRPKAIILVPTAELVAQVGALVKHMSHIAKVRAQMISSAFSATVIRNRLFSKQGVDLIVSTPHLLQSLTESDPNVLSRVSHLVVDEADSLLDRSFSPITNDIIDRSMPSLEQLIFVSATIPKSLDSYLVKRFPNTNRIVTSGLHRIPRRVTLGVVDIEKVPFQGNRNLACAQTIYDIADNTPQEELIDEPLNKEKPRKAPLTPDTKKRIIVFVNERETSTELATYLRSKGIWAVPLSRDTSERKQADILTKFTGAMMTVSKRPPPSGADSADTSPGNLVAPAPERAPDAGEDIFAEPPDSHPDGRALPNAMVLVMTDIGSRGIDTTLVKHVILYDVPHTSIDFIHRLGRLGRMERRGKAIVLVGKDDRRDIVREVREGMFKGQPLI